MTFALHDKVRVKANADFLVGVVGEIVAIDEERRLPYVVAHDVEGSPRTHAFAESELERAPIETITLEGAVKMDWDDAYVGETTVMGELVKYDGDEVRIIIEIIKRGER